jgi:hypothetical protein
MMLRVVAVALSVVALAACGGDDEAPAGEAWPGPPRPAPDGQVAVDGFNDYAQSAQASWTRSALLSTAEFLRLEDREGTTSVVLEQPAEGGSRTDVMVTEDGLLGDSIRATRYVLDFERQEDGRWRLLSARWSQRCWPNRGHQDFSPEPCV